MCVRMRERERGGLGGEEREREGGRERGVDGVESKRESWCGGCVCLCGLGYGV